MKKTVDTSSLNQLIKKTEKNLRLEKLPNYNPDNDPNLLRRIKYLTETYDNNDLGTQFDKAIDQEDRELAKLGRDPKNILQRSYPPAAGNKRLGTVEELVKKRSLNKRGLNTVVYDGSKPFHKPTYRKGDAKIIVDELKRQKRKANPILNITPVNIDISNILKPAVDPEPVTRADVQAEIDKFAKTQPKGPELNGIFGTNEYFLRKKGI